MTTTFETSPPHTVDEAKEYLRKVSFADVGDLELAAENFALAIYPLCCVLNVAYGGESHPEAVWRDMCDRFETESDKLLAVISTWIEYTAARDLVGGVTEARRIHAEAGKAAKAEQAEDPECADPHGERLAELEAKEKRLAELEAAEA